MQKVHAAYCFDFLSGETTMKTQKSMKSRTKGIAVIVLVLAAALVGMRLEFDSMQSLDWLMSDSKAVEGYHWMANNTESDATVLAWWDYADGIQKIGKRSVVINEASRNIKNTIAGYADSNKPWHKIEYALWYPFESDEKVSDVSNFFLSENATSAENIARKYKANYALVMSEDLGKYFSIAMASGANFRDYVRIPTNQSFGTAGMRPYLKKETIFTRMVNGDEIEGFSKAFDNGKMRIYELT
jgi:asparagine N-glycosylation enzyme membrane subunit Stt3